VHFALNSNAPAPAHFAFFIFFKEFDIGGPQSQSKNQSKVHTYQCHLGCGISKMVDPKKQDFWPKINILKGYFVFREYNGLQFFKKCQNYTFKINRCFFFHLRI
jgi:hypothetical protein